MFTDLNEFQRPNGNDRALERKNLQIKYLEQENKDL